MVVVAQPDLHAEPREMLLFVKLLSPLRRRLHAGQALQDGVLTRGVSNLLVLLCYSVTLELMFMRKEN